MAVPGVLSTRQPIATPNQPKVGNLQVAEGWFEHPKVRLAYERSDGTPAGVLFELQAILEATERCWEEIGRRGGSLEKVIERVEALTQTQVYGTESLNEIRGLLENGLTQSDVRRLLRDLKGLRPGDHIEGGNPDADLRQAVREVLRPTRATDEKIVEIYRSGLSIHDTAKALRTNHVIVSKVVRASGCPLHRPVKKACRPAALPPAA